MRTVATINNNLAKMVVVGIVAATAVVSVVGAPQSAWAQSTATESKDERADRLFVEGREAIKRNQFEAAYPLLREAWSLRRAYDIAALLGQVEVRLGKHSDAAKHLSFSLRSFSAKEAGRRRGVQKLLDQAKRQVMTVEIAVNHERADLLVDGAVVGVAPLGEPVFLDPGTHTIEARLAGYQTAKHTLVAERGGQGTVSLTLEPAAEPATPATSAAPAARPPLALSPREPDKPAEGRISTRTTVLLVEGAIAGVGLAVGTAYTVKSNATANDIRRARETAPDDGCSRPEYAEQCRIVTEAPDRRDREVAIRNGAFIAAGVAGLALVGTLLLWEPDEGHTASTSKSTSKLTSADLWVSPNLAGLTFRSSF